jgi:hypothetical protein
MFNKSHAEAVLNDLREMTKSIEQKHGIRVSLGTLRYTTSEMRASVTMRPIMSEMKAVDPSVGSHKLGPFRLGGMTVTVVDHIPSRPKYPYVVQDVVSGKRYKATGEWYRRVSS